MRSPLAVLWLAVPLSLAPLAAIAQEAHVPADYPTIQAAIDAGATPIYVADGDYHERLRIIGDVVIQPEPSHFADIYSGDDAFPRVDGLENVVTQWHTVTIRGIHFTGSVVIRASQSRSFRYRIEGCRFDSGLDIGPIGFADIHIRHCIVFGDLRADAGATEVTACTVIGGGIHAADDGRTTIRDCVVIGPAAAGIVTGGSGGPRITRNDVRGTEVGILCNWGTYVSDNHVRDCSEVGIRTMDAGAEYNVVEGCGVGIVADFAHGPSSTLHNLVLRCTGDGIQGGDSVTDNVVGRCGGNGIVAAIASRNTSYLNRGDGLVLTGPAKLTKGSVGQSKRVMNNIAYANGGYGMRWSGADTPVSGCNDWYLNASGPVSGPDTAPDDASVDPLFCDVASDSVGLRSDSPVLNAPGCGQMGARGIGCVDLPTSTIDPGPVPAPTVPAVELALAPIAPSPARSTATITYSLPAGMPVRISVLDVQGRRIDVPASGTEAVGRHVLRWTAPASVRAGVYFVRMEAGGRSFTRTLTLLD